MVTGINPSSAAADSGLQPGDVIQQVNRQPVKNTADFERAHARFERRASPAGKPAGDHLVRSRVVSRGLGRRVQPPFFRFCLIFQSAQPRLRQSWLPESPSP